MLITNSANLLLKADGKILAWVDILDLTEVLPRADILLSEFTYWVYTGVYIH